MSRLVTVLLFAMAFASMANTAHTPLVSDEAMHRYVLSFPTRKPSEARHLAYWLSQRGFDIAGMNWERQEIEIITTDRGVKYLESKNLRGRIVETRNASFGDKAASAIDERYLNPEKLGEKLKALHAAFPQVTRLEAIGKSLQGRPIWGLLISTTPDADDAAAREKPTILLDGMHHARELMTSEIVFDIAEQLLAKLKLGSKGATQFVDHWNVWVVPMLNVDGNNIVWTRDNWWRKNARATGNQVHGVDLNRNYSYRWAGCEGSSANKSSEQYRGESAASEPETAALTRLADMERPAASLSYHSYSELVLYPLGCGGERSGEHAMIERIGQELASKLPRDQGGGHYQAGTPWQLLYPVDGDSMDYMFAAFGTFAYTFEVNQSFQPPYTLREPTLRKQRVAWSYFFDFIDQNLLAIKVIDAKTNRPAVAELAIRGIEHTKGEKPFRTNDSGNFFKVLDKGSYVIAARLADGRSQEIAVEMKGGESQHVRFIVP